MKEADGIALKNGLDERSLDLILDVLPAPALVTTVTGNVRRWNAAASRVLGWKKNEVEGRKLATHFRDTSGVVETLMRRALDEEILSIGRATFWHGDGRAIDVEVAFAPMRDPALPGPAAFGVLRDISAILAAEQSAREQLHQLQVILDAIPAPIFYKDAEGIYAGCNVAFERYLGRSRDRVIGMSVYDVAPKDLAEVYYQADRKLFLERGVQMYEASVQYADGMRHDVVFHKAVFFDTRGEPSGIVGTMLDITARKRAEQELAHQAFHDALTGLPNRSLLVDRLDHALAQARRSGERVAVAFIDLDRFKLVNDTLGHDAGDALLKEAAQRLKSSVREVDTVSRLGGDEFVIVLPNVPNNRELKRIAERLLEACKKPLQLGEVEVRITPSMGFAAFPDHGYDAETLLRNADAAMYEAKDAKSGFHVFHADQGGVDERLARETELFRAIESSSLVLHYQPIFSLPDRRLVGFEALVRWPHPKRGILLPGEFISLAEETGLILPMGQWVFEQACTDLAKWAEAGYERFTLSVNVSALQFRRLELVDGIAALLERYRVEPKRLVVELTETSMMPGSLDALAQVRRLKALGVGLVIDDFGTGYSSFGVLRSLPIDGLKIDGSFTASLGGGAEGTTPLVQSMLALASNLGMSAVAEGVETEAQLEELDRLGCPRVQGFLLGRPADASHAEALMARELAK